MNVPVKLTAVSISSEIFGDGKIAEIEAIVLEGTSWSVWSLIPWS